MKRFRKISFFLLLGAFGILLLHQMLPHVYHVDSVTKTLSSFTEDHHHNSDRHDNIAEGILDILFHGHAHVNDTNTVAALKNTISPDTVLDLFMQSVISHEKFLPEHIFSPQQQKL